MPPSDPPIENTMAKLADCIERLTLAVEAAVELADGHLNFRPLGAGWSPALMAPTWKVEYVLNLLHLPPGLLYGVPAAVSFFGGAVAAVAASAPETRGSITPLSPTMVTALLGTVAMPLVPSVVLLTTPF